MSNIQKSLAWAGAIIVAAIIANFQGMSDPASAGLVLGLSGAAWGSLQSDMPCSKGCLR